MSDEKKALNWVWTLFQSGCQNGTIEIKPGSFPKIQTGNEFGIGVKICTVVEISEFNLEKGVIKFLGKGGEGKANITYELHLNQETLS